MTSEMFSSIVNIVVLIVSLVLTYFVVPYLKAKLGETKYNNILAWSTQAVAAAEQIYSQSGQGEKKKEYVLEFLKNKGITLTDKELDVLIESAVHELEKAVK